MSNDSFSTTEEQEAAASHFRTLLEHAGWKLFEEVVNSNIKIVEEQILSGVFTDADGNLEEYTQEQMNRKRDKLTVYREVRDTPKMMVDRFDLAEEEDPDLDPYESREQVKEERSEHTQS